MITKELFVCVELRTLIIAYNLKQFTSIKSFPCYYLQCLLQLSESL